MSRLGRQPVEIPSGTKAFVEKGFVRLEGAKGKLGFQIPEGVLVSIDGGKINVKRENDSHNARSRHGLVRTIVSNMVRGVSQGFEKRLDIVGVGFKAAVKGKTLSMTLGYSHSVEFPIPEGLTVKVENNTQVVVQGADKDLLGNTCAKIRSMRPPEPYQGKGVKYSNEVIRRKAGKAAAAGGGK